MDEIIQGILKINLFENSDSTSSEEESDDSKLKLKNKKMIEADKVNEYISALKLPDCIKDLPKYNGNKHTLHEFLENVQEIASVCGNVLPKTFLRAIRNKIVDDADEVLTMYGTPLDWNKIKENLTTHYADKRNETSLIRDLHQLYQGTETIENFFSKVIDIQSTLINHIKITEKN